MSILGIDYGEKQIGVAISSGVLASGLTVIYKNEALAKLSEICRKQKVEKIVLGLPEGKLKTRVENFAQTLMMSLHIPVVFQDETLTSYLARKTLILTGKSKKRRHQDEHQQAAVQILQAYLNQP